MSVKMEQKYKVKPVPTPNLIIHSDRLFQNYALALGGGEFVDVRTCKMRGQPREILLAQIVTLGGKVIHKLSPDQIELPEE
jgi:hypothetical protein